MRRVALVVCLVVLAVLPAGASAGSTAHDLAADSRFDQPRIQAIYPNPVADGDAGEFVVLSVPPETPLGQYHVGDDERTVPLPNVTASGRVVLSTAPNRTEPLVDGRVLSLDEIGFANDGEPVRLRRNKEVVDTLAYVDAPEGSLRVQDGSADWRPLGATDVPVAMATNGSVEAFVLPDAPDVAVDHLRDADDRILLGAYTLTSRRVADALVAAHERNVTVRVLVDGDPVAGLPRREARVLDRLTRAGIDVRALGGDYARYDFHHAKYAVADSEALVTTENWKPSGVGGTSSRGWGVVTDQRPIVSALAETFESDRTWRGAIPWQEYRSRVSVTESNATTGQYPSAFEPESVQVDRTRLLVAPDNAEETVVELIDNATETLEVEQVSIGSRQSPFLQAALDAARRGVRVRILLSGAWYTRETNQRLVDWLDERADSEGLPLTARLAQPRGSFEKIHAKGVIVDGDQVVLGSLNWNNNSARDNREIAVVLEGTEAGSYFQSAFEADWSKRPSMPVGTLLAIGLAAGVVILVVRRLRFTDGDAGFTGTDDSCLREG